MMRRFATLCTAFVILFTVCIEDVHASTLKEKASARREARLAKRKTITHVQSSLRERALARRRQRVENQKIRLELVDQLGDKDELRKIVLQEVNRERGGRGLPALQYNHTLEESAQAHAEDMLRHGYFSHYSRGGEDYVDRMKVKGYGNFHAAPCQGCSIRTVYGENIAKGQRTAKEVVKQWMESPPHRKNILSQEFEALGVGIAGVYWVQNFGAIKIEKIK